MKSFGDNLILKASLTSLNIEPREKHPMSRKGLLVELCIITADCTSMATPCGNHGQAILLVVGRKKVFYWDSYRAMGCIIICIILERVCVYINIDIKIQYKNIDIKIQYNCSPSQNSSLLSSWHQLSSSEPPRPVIPVRTQCASPIPGPRCAQVCHGIVHLSQIKPTDTRSYTDLLFPLLNA